MTWLAVKHFFDLVGNTLDLIAFSFCKILDLKYKLVLDFISIVLIIAVQCKLFGKDDTGSGGYEETERLWVSMEVGLFYVSILIQGIYWLRIYLAVTKT